MSEIEEAKHLRWLVDMFPYTDNPSNETDRINNAVHLYAEKGADKIEELQRQLSDESRTFALEQAFRKGMWAGYGIDHENIHEEEDKAVEEFLMSIKQKM